MFKDIRYSVRTLARSTSFTVVACVTLALGIGGTTAVFSVVNGVILERLPYPEPDRVVYLEWVRAPSGRGSARQSAWKYDYFRRHSTVFEAIETHTGWSAALGGGDNRQEVRGLRASAGFFRAHGVEPDLGRPFSAEEDSPGSEALVVLSNELWRTRYNADSAVLGETVDLEGRPHTIIGVMPEDFRFPELPGNTDFIVPFALEPDVRDQSHNYLVRARLAAGVTPEHALAELSALTAGFKADHPDLAGADEAGMRFMTYDELGGDQTRRMLWLLFGAVGFVLLIACTNVANLFLVRGFARQREIAIRGAMGASLPRIARQLVTEGLLISLVASALGVLLARWFLNVFLAIAPSSLPRSDEIGLDMKVLAFALGVSVLTGMVFGLVGAFSLSRDAPGAMLAAKGTRQTSLKSGGRIRAALAATEVSLSVVLLAGSGLLITSLLQLRSVNVGFDPDRVATIQFPRTPEEFTPARVWSFHEQVLTQIRRLPGVVAAGTTSLLPLQSQENIPMTVVGRPEATRGDVQWRAITSGYLDSLQPRLISGRFFDAADEAAPSPPVIIINERFAQAHFGSDNPVGERIAIGTYEGEEVIPDFNDPPREIIGVVADMKELNLRFPADETMYTPASQTPSLDAFGPPPTEGVGSLGGIAVRMGQADLPTAEVLRIIRDTYSRVPTPIVSDMNTLLDVAVGSSRYFALLLSLFAATSLGLAAIGVYAVVAATVRQRTAEIGLRMALGAAPSSVRSMVVRQGMTPILAGLVVGLAAVYGLGRFLRRFLYGISYSDPAVLVVAASILVLVALAAAYLPARTAARVDPCANLRHE
jgi:predicted permease